MAVKGADILHIGSDVILLDRLQTAGPGTVNIAKETIHELGNYRSVGQVSAIPDLQFSLESFDVSCEMEAMLLDVDPTVTTLYDPSKAKVISMKSAFKPGVNAANAFDTVASAAIPCLRLEQLAFAFGVGTTDAKQTASLRGDSLYYNPKSTYIQRVAGSGTAGQTVALTHEAGAIVEGGVVRYTLAIHAGDRRLNYGVDYTEALTAGSTGDYKVVIVTVTAAVASTDKITISYGSSVTESFPQSVHALVSGVYGTLTAAASSGATTITLSAAVPAGTTLILDDVTGGADTEIVVVASMASLVATLASATVNAHASGQTFAQYVPTVKPAAIRGRDIDVYIGASSVVPGTPTTTDMLAARGTKQGGIQTAAADWKVTLQNDEEFGNYHYVNIDFDVPAVTGSMAIRPPTPSALVTLAQQLSGETNPLRSAQSLNAPTLDLQIVLKNPIDGRPLKTIWVPDARFSLPGYSGKVQSKLDLTAAFVSDQGLMYIASV